MVVAGEPMPITHIAIFVCRSNFRMSVLLWEFDMFVQWHFHPNSSHFILLVIQTILDHCIYRMCVQNVAQPEVMRNNKNKKNGYVPRWIFGFFSRFFFFFMESRALLLCVCVMHRILKLSLTQRVFRQPYVGKHWCSLSWAFRCKPRTHNWPTPRPNPLN